MRSRYTAYTLGKESYLLQTWHPSTRPAQLALHAQPSRWLGLNVVATQDGGADATHGVVEFVARYKIGGKAHRLHEVSRFVKEGGRWFYVDGATSQI
jgi:SEC-C motif-containing protein